MEYPVVTLFIALFVWTYQHNQQPSSSAFLSQQTSEQYFQHNKPAKRIGCMLLCRCGPQVHAHVSWGSAAHDDRSMDRSINQAWILACGLSIWKE
jgi:hypothetical protein